MSTAPARRRHSPAVYRRRRLAVLLAVVLVVGAVVWLLVARPWSGSATPAETPSPTASAPSPSASPSGEPSSTPTPTPDAGAQPEATASADATPAAAACAAGNVLVEAVTDATSYAAGQDPRFSIRLTNTGEDDCTLNVGTSAQAFTVTSGSDVWWRSTDCQTEPSDMVVLLAAGQQVGSATPLVWDRTRSSVDSCPSERPRAPGGGATYHLSVAIGGISSTTTAAFQLS